MALCVVLLLRTLMSAIGRRQRSRPWAADARRCRSATPPSV